MSDNQKPFWQRPVPPIQYPGDPSVNGRPPVDTDPLADDPLADTNEPLAESGSLVGDGLLVDAADIDPLADDPLAEPETVMADGAAPADDDPVVQGDLSSPQARPVTLADAPVILPGVVAKAAEPEVTLPASPPLSVEAAQRRLVDSQMRCARATEAQGLCRGKVALALERFQRVAMVVQTQSDLAREFIASENEQRRLRAEGKLPQRGGHRRLGSEIDRFAFATRAMGRGAGGGSAFRRGAAPAARRTPK